MSASTQPRPQAASSIGSVARTDTRQNEPNIGIASDISRHGNHPDR